MREGSRELRVTAVCKTEVGDRHRTYLSLPSIELGWFLANLSYHRPL